MTGNTAAREEKKVQAHTGAVISVQWNYDGSALISAGEDGDLKVMRIPIGSAQVSKRKVRLLRVHLLVRFGPGRAT
jgi:hypothetical protein